MFPVTDRTQHSIQKPSVSPLRPDFSPPTSFLANYFGSFSFTVPFFLLQCFLSEKDKELPYRLIPPRAHRITTLIKEVIDVFNILF
jgi:hypothetical protein